MKQSCIRMALLWGESPQTHILTLSLLKDSVFIKIAFISSSLLINPLPALLGSALC